METTTSEEQHLEGWTRTCDAMPDMKRKVFFRRALDSTQSRDAYLASTVIWGMFDCDRKTHWRYEPENL